MESHISIITKRVGVYVYPWYCSKKWSEAPVPYHPIYGLYRSDDPAIIASQFDVLASVGFDYIVFELVSVDDWSFEMSKRSIEKWLALCRKENIPWSFLLDPKASAPNAPPSDQLASITSLIDFLGDPNWCDGLVEGPSTRPLLFVFQPYPEVARACNERYSQAFELRYPAYLPHWGYVDSKTAFPRWEPFLNEARNNRIMLSECLSSLGFTCFWQGASVDSTLGGFGSVIPGYDDRLLGRDPQGVPTVPRNNGQTMTDQFRSAVREGAQHILVYSWNEYFEGTNIEPTVEFGNTYVDLLRDLISSWKKGERMDTIHLP
jgi:hypothetical protein